MTYPAETMRILPFKDGTVIPGLTGVVLDWTNYDDVQATANQVARYALSSDGTGIGAVYQIDVSIVDGESLMVARSLTVTWTELNGMMMFSTFAVNDVTDDPQPVDPRADVIAGAIWQGFYKARQQVTS